MYHRFPAHTASRWMIFLIFSSKVEVSQEGADVRIKAGNKNNIVIKERIIEVLLKAELWNLTFFVVHRVSDTLSLMYVLLH